MKKIGNVKFKQWDCDVFLGSYDSNDKNALLLLDQNDREPVAFATVNIHEPINDDQVIIKDYSENEGIKDVLIDAGIISQPVKEIPIGFVIVTVHNLLVS